jgi:hypothetical protein
MAGSKTANVIPAPGAMTSPHQPGKIPDFVNIPGHVGAATPAATSKVRPLSQYGSAEAKAEVFSRFGDGIQPEQFEQAGASDEEVRKENPANVTPRRPRPPLGTALDAGDAPRELISGE